MPQVRKYLEDFYSLVEKLGRDFSLVQGLGGNASFKENGILSVKTSGTRFGDVRNKHYFYKCTLTGEDFNDDVPGQSGIPSIETFLHALLPQTYIIHLHSHNAVAASMIGSSKTMSDPKSTEQKVKFVPYARPGKPLSHQIKSQVLNSETEVLLLQNHGVIYFSDRVDLLENNILHWEEVWRNQRENRESRSFSPADVGKVLTKEEHEHVAWHAENNWRVSPDHVVFLGATPDEFMQEFELSRKILAKSASKPNESHALSAQDEQKIWFLNLALSLPKRMLPTLSLEEAIGLRDWESEKLRVQIAERNIGTM